MQIWSILQPDMLDFRVGIGSPPSHTELVILLLKV